MSITKNSSFPLQDTYSVSDLPPPPSYNFVQETHILQNDKRLRSTCPDSNRYHQNSSVPQVPPPNQAALEEAFYESKPFHQRRVCCLSLFWFAVICDICATALALIGTLATTFTCRADCVDNCNDICNPRSEKGLVASIVIFVLLTSAILVGKLACCCCKKTQ